MELLDLIMTLIWSLIVGTSSAVLLNAKPVRYMLELFNADSFELFNCALCFGFWYSWIWLLVIGIPVVPAFLFAGLGALTSELVTRKILFN